MNKNYLSISKIIILLILTASSFSAGQTSAWGNDEVYSRQNAQYTFGYLTTTITLPEYLGSYKFNQSGIIYTREYNIANLGSVLINSNNEINFFLRGAFRAGAGIGSSTTSSLINNYPSTRVKYYTATLDLFSMDIGADYTYVLDNGNAVIPRFQIGLINLGGTIGILNKGTFRDNAIGDVSAFNFSLKPSVYFDFGRSTLGFALFFNPFNILDYRIVPAQLFASGDRGIVFHDTLIKRFAFQILFSY